MAQEYASQKPASFKNRIENVALVGVNGQIGKLILDELLKRGIFKITALTRAESSAKPPPGVDVKNINYDDQSSIVSVLQGIDALVITMGTRAPPDQEAKLIEAAAAANVPWVFPNEFADDGSDESINKDNMYGVGKVANRQLIEKLGKSSYVANACGFWYEYSLAGPGLFGIDITGRTVTWFDDGKQQGKQRMRVSTWPQTARSVAQLLSLKVLPEDEKDESVTLSSYRNKVAYIYSFDFDQHELFESIKRVTKTTDADWSFSSVPVKKFWEINRDKFFGEKFPYAYALMIYSRYFFPDLEISFGGRHEEERKRLGLPKEDFDEATAVAVRMAEERYIETKFGLEGNTARDWLKEAIEKANAA